MGIKSTINAAAALAAVKSSNIRQEFALAKAMATEDEKYSNVQRNVNKAEAKVLSAAEKCETKAEELRAAETELEVAKAELDQARQLATAALQAEVEEAVVKANVDAN